MRIRTFVPWVLVATTSLGGLGVGPLLSRAHAQAIKEPGWPPPEGAACKPSKKDVDEAKTLFQIGKNAHEVSNYADAIRYYKDAYKRDCTAHLLLKNLGKVYEADAQYAAAVEAYKLFRTRGKPTGEELDLLDAKIANLSKKSGGGTGTTEPTSTGTTTAPTSTSTGAATTEPTTTATTTSTTEPTSTAPTPGDKPPSLTPWIVAGVGGAVLITGGVIWGVSNSTVSEKQDQFDFNDCRRPKAGAALELCESIKADGESASSTRTVGAVIAVVGLGVAVGGVVWALTSKKKSSTPAAVQITPGPTFAGIGLSGSF